MKRGANEKQAFERLEMTKEELLKMFGVSFFILIDHKFSCKMKIIPRLITK